jgi:hypothetical protein
VSKPASCAKRTTFAAVHGGVELFDGGGVASRTFVRGEIFMTSKPDPKNQHADKHPGMMGDGTEEQNLNQKGQPDARIKKDEVDAAFEKGAKKS